MNPGPVRPGYALPLQNSADLDQFAFSEAKWPESTLFAIRYVDLYQQPGSSKLTG